jgi:hypothetical protein
MKQIYLIFLLLGCSVTAHSASEMCMYGGIHIEQNSHEATTHGYVGLRGWRDLTDTISIHSNTKIYFDPYLNNGEYTIDSPILFVSYQQGPVQVNLGKIKPTLGYLSEYRGMPILEEMVYLPSAIYRDDYKKLADSALGVHAYYSTTINNYAVELDAVYAKPNLDNNEEIVFGMFGTPSVGKFTKSKSLINEYTVSLDNPSNDDHFRYSYIGLPFQFQSSNEDLVTSGVNDIVVHVLSWRHYFSEKYDITLERVWADPGKVQAQLIHQLSTVTKMSDPAGFGVVLRRHSGDGHTYYASYDKWELNPADPSGVNTARASGGLLQANRLYQNSISLGAHLRFPEYKTTVNIQYTKGNGLASSSLKWNDPSWNQVSIGVVHEF